VPLNLDPLQAATAGALNAVGYAQRTTMCIRCEEPSPTMAFIHHCHSSVAPKGYFFNQEPANDSVHGVAFNEDFVGQFLKEWTSNAGIKIELGEAHNVLKDTPEDEGQYMCYTLVKNSYLAAYSFNI